MMERRAFLAGAAALLVAPLAAEAQPAGKVSRLAWLGEGTDPGPANVGLLPFIEGLRDLGYIEGQHFTLDRRFAGGSPERLRELAAELAGLKFDLIAAPGTQAILALKAATSAIPIVMLYPGDPIGAGIVTSLNRPGGNITGTSLMFPDVGGKRLQILKEIVPTLRRVVVFWNPNNSSTVADMRSTERIAKSLGIQMQSVAVDGPGRLNDALSEVLRTRPEGMLVLQDTVVFLHRKDIADFALRNRLVTVFPGRLYVEESGGLLGYGPDLPAVGRRAAAYVDKILKGAKPGDLPIEQPTKFELVINLKTAKALGRTIPPSLLLQADRVIE
jgi:putative ABC transport system substrate-binding protein